MSLVRSAFRPGKSGMTVNQPLLKLFWPQVCRLIRFSAIHSVSNARRLLAKEWSRSWGPLEYEGSLNWTVKRSVCPGLSCGQVEAPPEVIPYEHSPSKWPRGWWVNLGPGIFACGWDCPVYAVASTRNESYSVLIQYSRVVEQRGQNGTLQDEQKARFLDSHGNATNWGYSASRGGRTWFTVFQKDRNETVGGWRVILFMRKSMSAVIL